ncbi:MAG TPA: hypothetical protein ENO03_02725, partial [Candidatus Aminicenantes bacterium]|nr:hypothetical protein [Candidatus Aminicenantes bacterium]
MHQRRRIVLLFGLGIVLPSLLLGYFAFRGIQNDRALVEKNRLEAARRDADQVVRAVDDELRAAEGALSMAVRDISGSPSLDPLIEEVFSIQAGNGIQFPTATLLYVPDGRREAGLSPAADPSRSASYQIAERLEFRDKDYPRAMTSYRRALERTDDPRLEGLILNALARVQKKAGLLRDAVTTYGRILRDHAGAVIPGGLPLGPSAALQIISLSRELGDGAASLRAALEFYQALLRRDWALEQAEFELFAGRARSEVESSLADAPPDIDLEASRAEFQGLRDEEAAARAKTERLLVFQGGAARELQARLEATDSVEVSGPHPLFSRSTLTIENNSYFVSLERPAARAGAGSKTAWGMIVDAERLREDILRPALGAQFPSGGLAWVVRSRDGAALASSEKPADGPAILRTTFASNFPDWTLEFHQAHPRLLKAFLLSRRGLYFFIFLLIAGILVFGLALTLRSVSHELELARMKSDFVSTVSHEFRSPLTSIRQLAEMLQSGRVPSDERRQKYYDVLLEQSERLALLTDNILSLARIEEGRAEFDFAPTDLGGLLTDVVSSFRERLSPGGLEIELDIRGPLPALAIDRTALTQAVTNLVDNAVKYSGESRRISVGARVEGQDVAIAVRDFGIGIEKHDLDRVFDRFFRGGNELSRSVKGSGLGLTLVREIVEAHGGR